MGGKERKEEKSVECARLKTLELWDGDSLGLSNLHLFSLLLVRIKIF